MVMTSSILQCTDCIYLRKAIGTGIILAIHRGFLPPLTSLSGLDLRTSSFLVIQQSQMPLFAKVTLRKLLITTSADSFNSLTH